MSSSMLALAHLSTPRALLLWSTDPNDCDRSFVAKPHRARINFFDLSGLPEYQELRQDFYSDTQGVLLVFDVTRRETFARLQQWLDEMHAAVRL